MRTADAVVYQQILAEVRLKNIQWEFVREFIDPAIKRLINDWQHREGINWLRSVMGRCTIEQCTPAYSRSKTS